MTRVSRFARAATYVPIAFAAAALVGVAHELGHFIPGYFLGWQPIIRFARGGSVDFLAHPDPPPAHLELLTLLGGPLVTLGLAGVLAWLAPRWPRSGVLVIFALYNAVFRLSVLLDGKGADEAKMSALVGVPYLFQSLSVIVSLVVSAQLIRRQDFLPRRLWLIPLAFVAFAACYISSLKAMVWVGG